MSKILKISLFLLFFALILYPSLSFAIPEATITATRVREPNVFTTAGIKLIETFNNSKMVLMVIGGFGLIALSFLAIFGKVKWPWFASLAFGLAVVCAAGAIVRYASNDLSAGKIGFHKMNDSYKVVGESFDYVDPSMEVGGSVGGVNVNVGIGAAATNTATAPLQPSTTVNSGGAAALLED